MNSKIEAIAQADAELNNAGLPTYSELLGLLEESRSLGLTFHTGTAYISRAFITQQDDLKARIYAARAAIAN